MKKLKLFLFLITAAFITNAQTIITGTVKDEAGNPLHYTFVGNNNEDKIATFTDSLGNFTIKLYKAKGLYFNLKGYKDTSVYLNNATTLQVVLKRGITAAVQPSIAAVPIQQAMGADAVPTYGSGGSIMPAHQQGALHGNRYLYDNFVHGFVIGPAGELIHNETYLFDYDKISGGLLLTAGDQNVTLVGWDNAKSFTLFDDHDQILQFTEVPQIDKTHYMQVLASGKNYQIYKLIKTRFLRADYVNTGVSSHGNDYDSYEDNSEYYLYNLQTNTYQKFSLRKKAIKEAFAADADKVNKYLADHSGSIDDAYLSDLGDYMNQ